MRVSDGARERCCRIARHPQGFKRSAEDLKRLAGWTVSGERLRQIVEREGERVGKLRESSTWSPGWSASDCRVAAQDLSRVYTGVDGFMVPMVAEEEKNKRRAARRKSRSSKDKPPARRRVRRMRRGHRERYKEFKLGVFYSQDKRRKHVQATGGNPEALGRNLRRAARRLGLAAADEVVAIVDGAPWIRNQLQRLGHCDHIGLDYYHFSEHVSEAARICFGEGSQQAATWRKRVLGLALETGVDEVLDEITQTCRRTRASRKREALRRLRNYIGERTAMIRYPQSRSNGWDIGSGPTEALCKTTAARLKGSGMRWDPAGAQAMLHLTALEDSNEWGAYWQLTTVHEN